MKKGWARERGMSAIAAAWLLCGVPLAGAGDADLRAAAATPGDAAALELRECRGLEDLEPGVEPVLRVPVAVHVGGSDLGDDAVCSIVEEVGAIWYAQAGICFELEIDTVFQDTGNPRADRSAEKRADRLNLWLLRSGELFPASPGANGVYLGGLDEAYTVDRPSLATGGVVDLAGFAAARTAAHEIGHALGLRHQDCGAACNNFLMRSGRRGFELATGAPADTNEIQRARIRAATDARRAPRGAPRELCAPPRFIGDPA